jgi:hypothetical protein
LLRCFSSSTKNTRMTFVATRRVGLH